MKRNLIYFICPLNHNKVWFQNVQKLIPYLRQFNGQKIITIATGENCVPSQDVIDKFPKDENIHFVISPNDQKLGETPHFVKMAKMVESKDEDEITFYAHAKGVSYKHPSSSIRIWFDKMYYHNLACIDLVEHIFSLGYDSIGCFRRFSRRVGKDINHSWHFSGTFFWFRHSSSFSHDWEGLLVKDCRWGVEGFLGKFMPIEKSFCVYGLNLARIGKRVHTSNRKEMWTQDTLFCGTMKEIGWEKDFPPEISTEELINRVSTTINANSFLIVDTDCDEKKYDKKFDILLVRGYSYEESRKNWGKALSLLNPNGIIMMTGAWPWIEDRMSGGSYKTVINAFSCDGVRGCTINSDNGISIFWKPKPLEEKPISISYTKLKKNPHLINLIDCCDVDLFMDAIQRENSNVGSFGQE